MSDQSTLLNETNILTRKTIDIKVDAVFIVVSVNNKFKYIKLHLVPSQSSPLIWSWIRDLLVRVLTTLTVIGHKMIELLSTIISHFKLAEPTLSSLVNWNICDVGIASFLINHSDPAHITMPYAQLLSIYGFDTSQLHNGLEYLNSIGLLMNHLSHTLKTKNQWKVFFDIEMKSLPIVAVMESYGISIDVLRLSKYEVILQGKIMMLEECAYRMIGYQFNMNSVPQLRKILYDELKLHHRLPSRLRAQTLSTSEQTLMLLVDSHPLPGILLEYRQVHKIKSLIVNLKEHVDNTHCRHLIGTCTGRMSSNNPNIQGLPKYPVTVKQHSTNDVDIIDVKGCIVARPRHSFLIFDFKSIELCLLGELSGDRKLLSILEESLTNGTDVFKLMASQWLGLNLDTITNHEREKTKRVVYSIIYGMGKERLSQLLNVSGDEAHQLICSFLGYYKSVQSFISSTIQQCQNTKYCSTMCGRQRLFIDIHSSNYRLKTSAERQCVNYTIQGMTTDIDILMTGSAADICKIVMIQIQQKLTQMHIEGRLLVQVHDELIYEVNDHVIEETTVIIRSITQSKDIVMSFIHRELQIPLNIRMVTSKYWKNTTTTDN